VYLVEFNDNPQLVQLVAATDQLKSAIQSGEVTNNWDIDTLLAYFRKFNIVLGPEDLYSMIKVSPLKNIISNIQGPEVIFKGIKQPEKQPETPPPEQSKEIVAKMAKKAMPKQP
jgi:hypothetical protein